MAAVEVTISGVLYDKTARTTQPVVLIGEASLTGLGIGGGPIIPTPPEEKPPQGPPGRPAFPIWGPPGSNFPDKPGYPPTVGGGPIIPPDQPPGEKPPDGVPPVDWKVVWSPSTGWIVVGVPNVPHPAPATA